MQRVVSLVEARHLVHVGRADQLPVDRVGPCVVGALDRLGEAAARLLAQSGAAVAAHVVERAQGAVPTAHDDHALARDGAEHVLAGIGDFGGATLAHPALGEDALLLFRVDLGRRVVVAGQRALALPVRFGGFDEAGHPVSLAGGFPNVTPRRSRPSAATTAPSANTVAAERAIAEAQLVPTANRDRK